MSQPEQPNQAITADQGFARLVNVLAVWVPARLYHAARFRQGLARLRRSRSR